VDPTVIVVEVRNEKVDLHQGEEISAFGTHWFVWKNMPLRFVAI
jgi:hypothetical protein